MTEAEKDTHRAFAAAGKILGGRDPVADMPGVLITLEHAVASVLLAVMGRDASKAARMLNEGLVPGIERRIMLYAARQRAGE